MQNYILVLCFFFLSKSTFSQEKSILKTYNKSDLLVDYDLVVASLKEAHPGLYWYTNYATYEKIFKENRNRIKDGMNSYEFYRIISRIVSADREGHSDAFRSSNIATYFNKEAKLLPIAVKTIHNKLYITNNIGTNKTRGYILTKINQIPIDTILSKIFTYKSKYSDGYSLTGQYKNLDYFNFISSYHYYIDNFKNDEVIVDFYCPKTAKTKQLTIPLIKKDSLLKIIQLNPYPKRKHQDKLFDLDVLSNTQTAVLTFNDFGYSRYERKNLHFESVVDSVFNIIKKKNTKNLVIDIRNCSGGSEGAEDYLFSYLTTKIYTKYKYVQASSLKYSFLEYADTDYKDSKEREELYTMLKEEHYLSKDGRWLRKEGFFPIEKYKSKPFTGNLYVLISGRTYSGGSEFAAIVATNSNAVFIGEESGGGFYGQTSGEYINLFLPTSDIQIRIPLLKFATNFKNKDIPFGRGVLPDYHIEPTYAEFINGIDSQLNYAIKLINTCYKME